MNRKLHNSLTALALSGGAVVLALGFVSLPATQAPSALAEQAEAGASLELVATGVGIAGEVAASANALRTPSTARDPASPGASQVRRKGRQPLVMPYFSFAPRG
ncbi:hypothetical protein [Marilutibacter aestuarii]|uniref:Uncharacterized protein n=1 Tax=Marilutibacter aestuarii TaxID=1706195 RepID=A0A508AK06_9GAMM|nr:hypothetical protein [Lysobacter aestuarii]TQD49787.1 hypothetical protein FKV25_03895 [Lysobacter aestuarii]